MEERIQSIKSYIDHYLDCAEKETDVIKKDSWTELAAYWSQYLKSISGIKYREKECNIYCQQK